MNRRLTALVILGLAVLSPCSASEKTDPYGSSTFHTFDGIEKLEQLKVAFDFNFADPASVSRALVPVHFFLKTVQEYGPVSFEPAAIVVVSHGSEAVVWAKQNYPKYKDIVDRAARFAELGVRFEVCVVAAEALGFKPDDFHGFVRVVPLGTYALAYHSSQGYAVIPGGAMLPGPIINDDNTNDLGK